MILAKQAPENRWRACVGDVLTIVDDVVSASGQEEHGKSTVRIDGKEHLSEHGNEYVLIATWRGSHAFETVAKKEGQMVGWGKYEVSADGRTLTISADQQMIVCDRQ